MALSNSQYDSIMRIYNQAQLRQKHELDKRREEIYEKIPAVKEAYKQTGKKVVIIIDEYDAPLLDVLSHLTYF